MPRLSPTVLWLGMVSLLTDASGEMIYPLLPLLLTGALHAGVLSIGVIEGAAESTAALLKLWAGARSDRLLHRKPMVVAGYGLSSLLRPLVAFATSPLGVLLVRVGDRVGKGIRGAPRDALLADVTPAPLRGRAYGLHRAMDHCGAVIGPLVATALLGWGMPLRQVFLWAAVPGALAVLTLLLLVREPPASPERAAAAAPHLTQPAVVALPPRLRRYLLALFVFSLGNSSDALLLLWARDNGVPVARIPLLWMAHNLVKAALSTPLSALSDRLGRRGVILAAWGLYAACYLGFATQHGERWAWALFALYGLYYALLEGTEKALVADLAPREGRGRAFGWFHAVIGITALPASLLAAALYRSGQVASQVGQSLPLLPGSGPLRAFGAGAALAGLAALLLLTVRPGAAVAASTASVADPPRAR